MTVPTWVRYGIYMDTNTADDLAQRVDGLRADNGLTVVELARDSQIPLTTLQRRLAGDGRLTVAELGRISAVLNVSAASWFPEVSA